jgi:hypothetical protein
MTEKIKKYRKAHKEYSELVEKLENMLIIRPVEDVEIYSPDNIRFYTRYYSANINLDMPRDRVEINELYNYINLPSAKEELEDVIGELSTEKQEFEKYIDALFEAIQDDE